MKKYPQADIAKIALENERQEGYVRIGKETIDTSKTKNNYHIVSPPETGYTEFIDQRIKQAGVKRKIKDDAIKMISFVMTSDKEFFESISSQTERDFFTDCVKFVKKRYGEENVISAVVHKDETTPHLHINFVPITPDNRLSAKYYFDGKLAKLQTAVYEEVGKKWSLARGKVGSNAKHIDPKAYNKVVKQATEDAKAQNKTLKDACDCLSRELDGTIKKNADLEEANEVARYHLNKTIEQADQARIERDIIIAERDKEADYNQALKDAKNGNIARGKKGMKEQIVALTVDNKRFEKENAILAKDNGDLFNEYKKAKGFEEQAKVAKNAMLAVRQHEPEAFARTFFKATGIMQAFVDMFTAPITLPRSRIREIEDEVEFEKQQEKEKQAKENASKYYWSK